MLKAVISMLKSLFFATALAAAFALPAFADEPRSEDENFAPRCAAPMPPPAIDGAKATQADMDSGKNAVDGFLSDSDKYQRCLRKFLGQKKDMAEFVKSTVPRYVTTGVETRIAANQEQKVQTGKDYNAAVVAFKAKSGTP